MGPVLLEPGRDHIVLVHQLVLLVLLVLLIVLGLLTFLLLGLRFLGPTLARPGVLPRVTDENEGM
jgi:hypothetical protein